MAYPAMTHKNDKGECHVFGSTSISNIGAFGDGVVKIGMTRRLEPEERVKELGDASVPFPFDLHALIYSENAPELEARLQEHFWERRVNWSNNRKEFFRIALNEIQAAIRDLGLTTELQLVAKAREYRETVVARRCRQGDARIALCHGAGSVPGRSLRATRQPFRACGTIRLTRCW